MSYSKKGSNFENFTDTNKVGESFNFTKEGSNSVWNESFVYRHEGNKISASNDVGYTGKEENTNVSKKTRDQKKIADESDEIRKSASESSSSSSTASSSTASTSSTTAASTTSTNAAATTATSAVSTAATVATTAVVAVAGVGIAAYAQNMEPPAIVQFEEVWANKDTISFSLIVGNDVEKIMSGEENDECAIVVELGCESYKELGTQQFEVNNYGMVEGSFENLMPDTEYTLNVIQLALLGLDEQQLIEPYYIKTDVDYITPTGFVLNETNITLDYDETFQAQILSVEPEDGLQTVNWTSDDESVATVDEAGLIKAVTKAGGSTVVRATSTVNPDATAAIEVTVNKYIVVPETITLNVTGTKILDPDETLQLSVAGVSPEDAETGVRWLTDDTDGEVITLSEDGLITAVNGGEALVWAESIYDYNIRSEELTIKVNRRIVPPTAINLNYTEDQTLYIDDTLTLSVTSVEPSNAELSFTWTSSDSEVVKVTYDPDGSETCSLLALSAGEVTVTATSTVASDVSKSINITVKEREPEAVLPESIEFSGIEDGVLSLEYTSEVISLAVVVGPEDADDKSFRFETSETGIINVVRSSDEEGILLVETLDLGTVSLTVTCEADTAVHTTLIINVIQQTPQEMTIVGPENDTIKVGKSASLSVSVYPEGAFDEVTWSSSDETVATIDSDGVVLGLKEGVTTITATSTRDSNITATLELNVEVEYGIHLTGTRDHLGNVSYHGGYTVNAETETVPISMYFYDSDNIGNVDVSNGNYIARVSGLEMYTSGSLIDFDMPEEISEDGVYYVRLTGLYMTEQQDRVEKEVYNGTLDMATIIGDASHSNELTLEHFKYVDAYNADMTGFDSYYGYIDIGEDEDVSSALEWKIEFNNYDEPLQITFDVKTRTIQSRLLLETEQGESLTEFISQNNISTLSYKVYHNDSAVSENWVESYNSTIDVSAIAVRTKPIVESAEFGIVKTYYNDLEFCATLTSSYSLDGFESVDVYCYIDGDNETTLFDTQMEIDGYGSDNKYTFKINDPSAFASLESALDPTYNTDPVVIKITKNDDTLYDGELTSSNVAETYHDPYVEFDYSAPDSGTSYSGYLKAKLYITADLFDDYDEFFIEVTYDQIYSSGPVYISQEYIGTFVDVDIVVPESGTTVIVNYVGVIEQENHTIFTEEVKLV